MNFIFRVDSSSIIGHGHLMRCLTLAHELYAMGMLISFICRDAKGSLHSLIDSTPYTLYILSNSLDELASETFEKYSDAFQKKDADECNQILNDLESSHIIVDHYSLDITWEKAIKNKRIIVIDDLANRQHACEILIDQSLINHKSDYIKLIESNFVFIGNNNIILRKEFREACDWELNSKGILLIAMGGADPKNITTQIASYLNKIIKDTSIIKEIHIIIGGGFSSVALLSTELRSSHIPIKIFNQPSHIAEMMRGSTVCILSCGTMILEACSLGVPSIGVAIADNQINTAAYLDSKQAIKYLPINSELSTNLKVTLMGLLQDQTSLKQLSAASKKIINKRSATQISKELIYDLNSD